MSPNPNSMVALVGISGVVLLALVFVALVAAAVAAAMACRTLLQFLLASVAGLRVVQQGSYWFVPLGEIADPCEGVARESNQNVGVVVEETPTERFGIQDFEYEQIGPIVDALVHVAIQPGARPVVPGSDWCSHQQPNRRRAC